MELHEVMMKRRSIRKYKEDEVSKENIDLLLHYAMSGPSACNKQPWEFIVVCDKRLLEELRKASRYTNVVSPVIIIVCGNLNRALPTKLADYWIQDCSASCENILLGATSLNLGSLWCGIYPQPKAVERVKEILELPDNLMPLAFIMLGYADEAPLARDQYDVSKIHYL